MNKQTTPQDQNNLDNLATAWARMISSITHDLTTPLMTVRMGADYIEKILPELITGYEIAIQNNSISEPQINKNEIEILKEKLIPSIQESITDIMNFLHILHPLNKVIISTAEETTIYSANFYIETELKKYPFSNSNEKEFVQVNCEYDFKFSCAPIFAEQLFNNLLSNALRAIQDAGKGNITIWTESEENFNTIHFKDTASGMSEGQYSRIFSRFFSEREGTVKPGLGFCRLALLQRGGDLVCKTVEGEFTHFILKFPK